MTTALTFNDTTISPLTHQNSLWIRAAELARALGIATKARFPAFTAAMLTNSPQPRPKRGFFFMPL